MTVLDVRNLTTRFYGDDGVVTATNGIDLTVEKGETLGVVGESGSGKSVTARSVMNLIDPPGRIEDGEVRFKGRDLLSLPERELQDLRGNELSIVFQDPMSSLNPIYPVGYQIARVIRRHRGYEDASPVQQLVNRTLGRDIDDAARREAIELMRSVRIPEAETRYADYPHEFSGGMAQRSLIAMALACRPELLIADEPTTGLDVTIQAEIFDLLADIREEFDMSLVLITHDLSVAAEVCDRIAVMYAGEVIETGTVAELFRDPCHPYTEGLLESVPQVETKMERLNPIPGDVPELSALPEGCNFAPRCKYADEECRAANPPLEEKQPGREAACFKSEQVGRGNQ